MKVQVREIGQFNAPYYEGEVDTVHCGSNVHVSWIGIYDSQPDVVTITTRKQCGTELLGNTVWLRSKGEVDGT